MTTEYNPEKQGSLETELAILEVGQTATKSEWIARVQNAVHASDLFWQRPLIEPVEIVKIKPGSPALES